MTETIASAVVDLARLALYAYAVRAGRDVITHWLNVTPQTLTEMQIIDHARKRGITCQP